MSRDAQSSFHMRYLDAKLFGGDRTGRRRVHITHHDDQVWLFSQTDFLELHHDPGRLLGMGSRAHFQVDIGCRHTEIGKEGLAHSLVVVLAGMDENMIECLGVSIHYLDDRRHFHEIRAGAYHVDHFHNRCSRCIVITAMAQAASANDAAVSIFVMGNASSTSLAGANWKSRNR